MATVLLAWEFGGGLGHVARMQPLVAGLSAAGHRVVVAARDVPLAKSFFAELPVEVVQAPCISFPRERIKVVYSFSHVLFNCAFAEYEALLATATGWRTLFDSIQPELLVADYSPVALLAVRGTGIKAIALGTGFECPPDESPLPSIRPGPAPSLDAMRQIEDEMLVCMNAVATEIGATRFTRVADLFHQDVQTLLLTYPELDPYERPVGTHYCGVNAFSPGKSPDWPNVDGPRLFVYLKPNSQLESLVSSIAALHCSTILYAGAPPSQSCPTFVHGGLRIESELLSHEAIVSECDLAITNGGHLLAATLLLAGKPMVIVPQSLEQQLNGIRVRSMGAGELLSETDAARLPAVVSMIIASNSYPMAAERFASKYRTLCAAQRLTTEYIERILLQ